MLRDSIFERGMIEPMTFPQPSRTNDMQCVWMGIGAVAVVYMLLRHDTQRYMQPVLAQAQQVASMVTQHVHGSIKETVVSAKAALVKDDVTTIGKETEVVPKDTEKMTNKALECFASSKPTAVLIFAHWCPHCKGALKEMKARAPDFKAAGVDVVVINGESVDPSTWRGAIQLKHYPTFVVMQDGVPTECGSIDDMMQKSTQTKGAVTTEVDTSSPEGEMELFAQLF
jgi:thiol-disulfide isomerase/thioredoxin